MVTAIDKRRLRDGFRAEALLDQEPQSPEELKEHLEILSDGIVAMQSLDDLGSPAANQAAMEQMRALFRRYEQLKERVN